MPHLKFILVTCISYFLFSLFLKQEQSDDVDNNDDGGSQLKANKNIKKVDKKIIKIKYKEEKMHCHKSRHINIIIVVVVVFADCFLYTYTYTI